MHNKVEGQKVDKSKVCNRVGKSQNPPFLRQILQEGVSEEAKERQEALQNLTYKLRSNL